MHVVENILFREFASHLRKMHIANMLFFFRNLGVLHFCTVFYHLRHGCCRERKNTGRSKLGFWDSLAHFEVEGPEISVRDMCHKNSRLLPRVVCLCGAVGVYGECHRVGHVVIFFSLKRCEIHKLDCHNQSRQQQPPHKQTYKHELAL